jgi:hypothetical protein
LALRRGRHKNPSQSPEGGQEQSPTLATTPPLPSSRLGGGNHQEKQETRSSNDPQVPLDTITQANTLGITQSHFGFTIKQGR